MNGYGRSVLLGSLLAGAVWSQPQDGRRNLGDLDLQALMEIPIVSAARHQQSRAATPRSVSVITGEEIRRRNFRNVPEAVSKLTGVYLQQTNYGGGSPILRGMIGNRILLLVNGVRMNNGTYRLGPNQYLNLIDVHRVERIEVVRGAGSVLYGSDAFGGVINVITKAARDPRSGPELAASAQVRFSSADRSGAGRLELSGARGPISFTGGFTQEGFGDLRAGGATGLQPFTGYTQGGLDATITYALGANRTLEFSAGRLKLSHVPRTDALRSGLDLQHEWTALGRDFSSVQYTQTKISRHLDALQIKFLYQRPFEDLSRVAAADPNTRRYQRDEVISVIPSIQLTSSTGSHLFTYGVESAREHVHSGRTDVALRTGLGAAKNGLYPDDSSFNTLSVYGQDEITLGQRLNLVLGARHDRFHLQARVRDPLVGEFPVNGQPKAVTGSGYLLYALHRHVSLFGGVAQGFRAPNVDDSSIIGGGSRFDIPNPQLRPERSVNVETGVRLQGRSGTASVAFFDDSYRNLIDRAPGQLAGLPFVDVNGNGRKEASEPEVWQRQNLSRARVRGLEAEGVAKLNERWTWSNSLTFTRGTDVSLGVPLTRIPPLNGNTRLTWESRRWLWVEGVAVAAASQRRLAPADRTDARIGPGGTAGYLVFHLRAGFKNSFLNGFNIAIENVTNQRYRLHGSGFDRPGVNLVAGFTRAF